MDIDSDIREECSVSSRALEGTLYKMYFHYEELSVFDYEFLSSKLYL